MLLLTALLWIFTSACTHIYRHTHGTQIYNITYYAHSRIHAHTRSPTYAQAYTYTNTQT